NRQSLAVGRPIVSMNQFMEVSDLPWRTARDRLTPQIHFVSRNKRIRKSLAIGCPVEQRIMVAQRVDDAPYRSKIKSLCGCADRRTSDDNFAWGRGIEVSNLFPVRRVSRRTILILIPMCQRHLRSALD